MTANDKVIEVLEDVLARAIEGKVVGVAIATVRRDHGTGTAFLLGDATVAGLLGAVALLQHRILVLGEKGPLD